MNIPCLVALEWHHSYMYHQVWLVLWPQQGPQLPRERRLLQLALQTHSAYAGYPGCGWWL